MSEAAEAQERLAMGVSDAARAIGIGRSKIYQAIGPAGSLKSIKIGKRRLIRRVDLDAWLESHAA